MKKILAIFAICVLVIAQGLIPTSVVKNTYYAEDFQFTFQPGTHFTVSTDMSVPGTQSISIRSPYHWPYGVAGADTAHYLYISGGTGTAEAVLITGGTATSYGSTGNLTFTTAYAHTGSYTITSATSGIQEVLNAAGDGALVIAGSSTASVLRANVALSGTSRTLQVVKSGINATSGSIVMSGTLNTIKGQNYTLITTSNANLPLIKLTGCAKCSISGLRLDRDTTATAGGNGIEFASGSNDNFIGENLTIRKQYDNIYAALAMVASRWSNINLELGIHDGLALDAMNDEDFTNLLSNYNGRHAIRIGKGTGTTNCIGAFRVTNVVTFANAGDGFHMEGDTGANMCTYAEITNGHFDTDTGYEIYLKNAGAVSFTSTQAVNGQGVYIGSNTGTNNLGNMRINGSANECLLITGDAGDIVGAGMVVSNCSLSSPGTSYGIKVNTTGSNINITGLQIGNAALGTGKGILVQAGTRIHFTGTQFTTMPSDDVTITGGTDVFVDAGSGAWQTLSLENGWSTVASAAARLEENGRTVRIRGTIQAGTVADGTRIFTLPTGYYPSVARAVTAVSLNGSAVPNATIYVAIANDGKVTIYGAATSTYIRLDNIAFSIN